MTALFSAALTSDLRPLIQAALPESPPKPRTLGDSGAQQKIARVTPDLQKRFLEHVVRLRFFAHDTADQRPKRSAITQIPPRFRFLGRRETSAPVKGLTYNRIVRSAYGKTRHVRIYWDRSHYGF